MNSKFLDRVHKETPTRYWVNNPNRIEIKKAIEGDATSCTTNPAFCSKLLQNDGLYMRSLIAKAVTEEPNADKAAERAYHLACKDLMAAFMPVYIASGGKKGFVTVQDDPRRDWDTAHTLEAFERVASLGANYMAKIPVIAGGIEAIEELVAKNIPVCATEIFTISQAVDIGEVYKRTVEKTGNKPPFYVTHITGILDQYFGDLVKNEKISIDPDILKQAGTIIGRKEYRIWKERGYDGYILGGGARWPDHFRNFIGGDMHITINWSTVEELNAADGPIERRIDEPTPNEIIQELKEKLPNFRRAYEEDGLKYDEFADFGPVMLFKTMFLNGYSRLIDEVRFEMAKEKRK